MSLIVDAHADLAWNNLTFGRDYTRSVAETRALEAGAAAPKHNGHTLLGWPDWIRGEVGLLFATLFATPIRWKKDPWDTQCYANTEEAYHLYRVNLDYYTRLVDEHPDKFVLIRSAEALGELLISWESRDPERLRVGLVLLMEGADALQDPGDLAEWYEAGVRILGPSWAGTRYAGGTGEPGPLTQEGYALLDAMAEWGLILDLSHMTEEGMLQALDHYPGQLIVSHGNPKARIPHDEKPERHLRDDVMVRVAERNGVIGIIVRNKWVKDGWTGTEDRDFASLDDVVTTIDHVCQVIGNVAHVGIGSDFDGGFGLNEVPADLDTVADLRLIGNALASRGYPENDIQAILGGNWLDVLRNALP